MDDDELRVTVDRGRVWIVRGVQSFMLAYDDPKNMRWYAARLRSVLHLTPKAEASRSGGEVMSLANTIRALAATWPKGERAWDSSVERDIVRAFLMPDDAQGSVTDSQTFMLIVAEAIDGAPHTAGVRDQCPVCHVEDGQHQRGCRNASGVKGRDRG